MGRKADLQPKFGRQTYEAKLRRPGDRIDGNGDKIEGGKIFSRHFEANNTDHAQRAALKFARKCGGKVVSISKVSPEEVIGHFKTWDLRDIIGRPMSERRRDVILDNMSLDEIVFNRRK